MKWVTRQFVHVDRTACPWLIQRFIDPKAKFFFVPTEKIPEIVLKEGAIPYDTKDVELTHQGEKCSFDAIIEKYNLTDPALLDVASIVRAADTDTMEKSPEAAGLEAIMSGIAISTKNDHEAIKTAAPIYEALYTNCKLKLIKTKYRDELEKIDPNQRREFLKKKLFGQIQALDSEN